MTGRAWFVDTSVLLRAMLGASPAAQAWLDGARVAGDTLVGSRLLDVETRRVVLNQELAGILEPGHVVPDAYLSAFELATIDAELLEAAATLRQQLRTVDAIHVATAVRIGVDEITVVTHDRQMQSACTALGFAVVDPVTDDPLAGPSGAAPPSAA